MGCFGTRHACVLFFLFSTLHGCCLGSEEAEEIQEGDAEEETNERVEKGFKSFCKAKKKLWAKADKAEKREACRVSAKAGADPSTHIKDCQCLVAKDKRPKGCAKRGSKSVSRCKDELLEAADIFSEEEPAAAPMAQCLSLCAQKGRRNLALFSKCEEMCIALGTKEEKGEEFAGAIPVPILAKVKVRRRRASISITSFPSVVLRVKSAGELFADKDVTTDKKGRAKVVLKDLGYGSYNVEVFKEGDLYSPLSPTATLSFSIDAPVMDITNRAEKGAAKSSALTMLCSLSVDGTGVVIPLKKSVSGRTFPLLFNADGRSRMTIRSKGLKSLTYDGKKRRAKKGKASFTFKRKKVIGEALAHSILSENRGQMVFEGRHKAFGKFNGRLYCDEEKQPPFRLGKPFLRNGESTQRANKGVAVIIKKERVESVVGPSNAKASDVDYFIEVADDYKAVGSCRYRTPDGGVINVEKNVVRKIVTVYDRRTGKVLKKKTFSGGRVSCPQTISADSNYTFGDHPDPSKVDAFIKDVVRRL